MQSESLVSTDFSTRKTSVWKRYFKIDKNSIGAGLTFRAIKIRDEGVVLVVVRSLSRRKKQRQLDKKNKEDLEHVSKKRTEQLRRLNGRIA